jgi:dTDP-4-amino-4,6-dideoxygalactose transaminase
LKEDFGVSLSGEVYDTPLHRQPVFSGLPGGPFPGADDICARHVCLPLYPGMKAEEISQVVDALAQVLPAGRSA